MKNNYFLVILVLALWSCKKELSHSSLAQKVDVYVAGFVDSPNKIHPVYWKNGNLVQLSLTSSGVIKGWASSIAVSGNDVYVAGYRTHFSFNRSPTIDGMFWKNGVEIPFDLNVNGPSSLPCVIVSGNDVYVVVQEDVWGNGEVAHYWKNGNLVELTDGSNGSTASSIVISGSDVYVAGIGYGGVSANGSSIEVGEYWKNGTPVVLSDATTDVETSSIAVSGGNVYVAATQYDISSINGVGNGIAKYWKNKSPINLTDGSKDATANSIAMSGNDVYVAGNEGKVAKYWKNGSPVNLTDGLVYSVANAIVISGNDVYVAGQANGLATYWKNGVAVNLSKVSSGANSILITKQ